MSRLLMPTLVLLITITSVVSSLGAPLVPTIARDADVSLDTAQWGLTATLLVGAVATPLLGRLGGNRRRRRVILGSLLIVVVGTLLCALPLGFPLFLAGRALQGVGIALTPLALAVARESVAPERIAAAISLLSVAAVAGVGLGYPLMALVAQALGVSSAFWLGFAICVATLALTVTAVPQSGSEAVDRVDWIGAALLAIATTALLIAVTRGGAWGWGSSPILLAAAAAATTLTYWVLRTLRISYPLVDLRLASRSGTIGSNVTTVIAGIAAYMLLSLVVLQVQAPTVTEYGMGRSLTTAGLLLTPYAVASVLGSRLTAWLWTRMTPDLILPLGCAVYLAATLGLAIFHQEIWQVAAVMATGGLGSGLTFAAMPGLVVRDLPREETGSATAFHYVLRFTGFATGSALALALMNLFAGDRPPTEQDFVRTLLAASGLLLVAALVSLVLGLRQRSWPRRAWSSRPERHVRPEGVGELWAESPEHL